jgi:hypothetical protein
VIFELRQETEPTEQDCQLVRLLWEDHYALSGIMDKTGLSYAVVKAAILRAKEERAAAKL